MLSHGQANMPPTTGQGAAMLALLAIFAVLAALFTEFGLLLVRAYLEAGGTAFGLVVREDERQMNSTLRRVSAGSL